MLFGSADVKVYSVRPGEHGTESSRALVSGGRLMVPVPTRVCIIFDGEATPVSKNS